MQTVTLERDQLGQRGPGDSTTPGTIRGLDHVRNPQLNKVCVIIFIFIFLEGRVVVMQELSRDRQCKKKCIFNEKSDRKNM